jgi:hypothetical protein
MIEIKEGKLTIIKVPAEDVDKLIAKLPKEYINKVHFTRLAIKMVKTAVNTCNSMDNALVVVAYKFDNNSFKHIINAFIDYVYNHPKPKVLIIAYQKDTE